MAVTSVSSSTSTYTSSSDSVENPDAELDKDAFLKLFLAELQYQDPTEPMDSDKILTQTSQLTELETQEQLKETLEAITESLAESNKINMELNAVSTIGKMAESAYDSLQFSGTVTNFELYFEEPISGGEIELIDSDSNVVGTIDLSDNIGEEGYITFGWDGSTTAGGTAEDGLYQAVATYEGETSGEQLTAQIGAGKVESVKYEDGETYLKIGSSYIPFGDFSEFF